MESLLQNYFRQNETNENQVPIQQVKRKLTPEELYQVRIGNLSKKGTKSTQPQQVKPLAPAPKKRKTKRELNELWTKDYKFVSIDPPLENNEGIHRYSVTFKYRDPTDGKTKKKSIKFGKKDVKYLIDHKNDVENRRFLNKQKGYYSPFNKNFWCVSLLCSDVSIQKAYTKLLSTVL